VTPVWRPPGLGAALSATLSATLSAALLAAGCAAAPREPVSAQAYWGAEGRRIEFAPLGLPDEPPLSLRMEEGTWTLRLGERWADAAPVASYLYATDDGLWLNDDQLIPENQNVGGAGEGCEVVAEGEATTWYGTFPDTLTVSVEGGDWAGEAVYAAGVGPVLIAYQGATWELVYYE
jgi:hypothetical protein